LSTQNISKSINKLSSKGDKKEEREWLLLGEPSSPVVRTQYQEEANDESLQTTSDVDCIVKNEVHGESDSSEDEEDIDSIVEEFQQKLKVSTSGLKDITIKIPSLSSWRFSMIVMSVAFGMCIFGAYGAGSGSITVVLVTLTGESLSPQYLEK
jgi:hypothetical protein